MLTTKLVCIERSFYFISGISMKVISVKEKIEGR